MNGAGPLNSMLRVSFSEHLPGIAGVCRYFVISFTREICRCGESPHGFPMKGGIIPSTRGPCENRMANVLDFITLLC